MNGNQTVYPDNLPIGGKKRLYPACKVCRRPLKNPKSQEIGMGPKCAGKFKMKRWEEGALTEKDLLAVEDFTKVMEALRETIEEAGAVVVPIEIADVILIRDDRGNPIVNVPRLYVKHSPTGFEFGYGGSGPADLALNILARILPPHLAWDLHQPFKWRFIATVDQQKGGVIKGAEIRAWIMEQLTNEGDRATA